MGIKIGKHHLRPRSGRRAVGVPVPAEKGIRIGGLADAFAQVGLAGPRINSPRIHGGGAQFIRISPRGNLKPHFIIVAQEVDPGKPGFPADVMVEKKLVVPVLPAFQRQVSGASGKAVAGKVQNAAARTRSVAQHDGGPVRPDGAGSPGQIGKGSGKSPRVQCGGFPQGKGRFSPQLSIRAQHQCGMVGNGGFRGNQAAQGRIQRDGVSGKLLKAER